MLLLGIEEMITKEILQKMKGVGYLHHMHLKDFSGAPVLIRLNGKLKTWKTRPEEFQQPVRQGLYSYFYITHENCEQWTK